MSPTTRSSTPVALAVEAANIEFDGRASYRNSRFVNNLIVQMVPGTITRIQVATGTPDLTGFVISNNLYSKARSSNGRLCTEPGRVVADALLANPIMPVMSACRCRPATRCCRCRRLSMAALT